MSIELCKKDFKIICNCIGENQKHIVFNPGSNTYTFKLPGKRSTLLVNAPGWIAHPVVVIVDGDGHEHTLTGEFVESLGQYVICTYLAYNGSFYEKKDGLKEFIQEILDDGVAY